MKETTHHSLVLFVILLTGIFLWPINCTCNGDPLAPPQLVSPPDGATNVSLDPRLEWSRPHNVSSYQIQIYALLDGVSHPIISYETEDTFFDLSPGHLTVSMQYTWQVRSIAPCQGECTDRTYSNWSAFSSFTTLTTPALASECEMDRDCDGIPDQIEHEHLKTDVNKKTLFVRPKKEIAYCSNIAACSDDHFGFWHEFYSDLFPGSTNGRANIPAFNLAGIEVVIIGSSENPYPPMREFDYDPSQDDLDPRPDVVKRPPCDIMEIISRQTHDTSETGIVCETCDDYTRKGRTWLKAYSVGDTLGYAWTWCTFGFTPSNIKVNDYFVPQIFPFPVDRYIKDGPYQKIQTTVKPATNRCDRPLGSENCERRSTINLVDTNPYAEEDCSRDLTLNIPCVDDTVEFNAIALKSDGEIEALDEPNQSNEISNEDNTIGKQYTKNQVTARIVVHEMGHAILSANNIADHCANPQCIMSRWTQNWEPYLFGSSIGEISSDLSLQRCDHSPGGSKDIRMILANGGIHNSEHP